MTDNGTLPPPPCHYQHDVISVYLVRWTARDEYQRHRDYVRCVACGRQWDFEHNEVPAHD